MKTNKNIKVGQKVKMIIDIPSVNGMLYKGTIVKIDSIGYPDKDLRVIDDVGKIWYINFNDINEAC